MTGRGKHIVYSPAELAWIKRNCTMTRRALHADFCSRFGRADVTLDHLKALCTRRDWKTGRDGRLKPGNKSWNEGKKMPYNANSARTQFKKGQLPPTTKYLGHERVSKDGYIEISIDQKNPHTGFSRRYVLKHRWLWEKKNGPVPAGMCLKCKDSNRLNTDPGNWELISRGVLPLLSGRWDGLDYDAAAPEVKPAIMTLAKLRHVAKHKKAKAP